MWRRKMKMRSPWRPQFLSNTLHDRFQTSRRSFMKALRHAALLIDPLQSRLPVSYLN
jgi:hypothetical protein